MKILKTNSRTLEVRQNENGTLNIVVFGTETTIANIGMFINQMGGVDAILAACQEYESAEHYQTHIRNLAAKRAIELAPVKAAKLEQQKLAEENFKQQISKLLSLEVIPATRENLKLIMRHLNESNWGTWELPKMEIGYAAYSFDCDGRPAVAVKLDKQIDGHTMYSFNAPRGHLNKYQPV